MCNRAVSQAPGFATLWNSVAEIAIASRFFLLALKGGQVRFYDDLIKNNVVFINFVYARCDDICPGMTVKLRKLENELGVRV